VVGQSRTRLLFCTLLALGLGAGGARGAPPQDTIRLTHNVPGDSKPLVVDADEIVTWVEGGRRAVLLRGRVLAQQGVILVRCPQAVLWLDQDRYQRTRILHTFLYAEGDVRVEKSPDVKQGTKAVLDLTIRGELRLNAHKGKVVQEARPGDELFRRAVAEISPPPSPPPQPIRQTSFDPAQQGSVVPAGGSGRTVQGPPPAAPAPPPTVQPPGPPPSAFPGPPTATPPGAATPPSEVTPPGAAPPAPAPPPPPQQGPVGLVPTLNGPPRQFSILPRSPGGFQTQFVRPPGGGEQIAIITGGAILTVRGVDRVDLVDIEADTIVVWTPNNDQQALDNMQRPGGTTGRQMEFYLSGNVEMRQQSGGDARTLRADEVYYDASRNVAVALSADLEFKQPGLPEPIHFQSDEIHQLSTTQFEADRVVIFASRQPSDPGLTVVMRHATLEQKRVIKRSIFGRVFRNRQTGEPESETQSLVRGDNVFFRVEDVPVFYLPFLQGDANDPLGPIQSFNFGWNRIFGAQLQATLDVYDLIGMDPLPGTRWRMDLDYLSNRGPGLGTQFDYAGKDLFGIPSRYNGLFTAWGLHDTGTDNLGGGRGPGDDHPEWRGRALWRQHLFDMPYGFSLQTQAVGLSDHNFYEQFFKTLYDTDINQETFAYLKQQQGNWAWTLLGEPRLRPWVTETQWAPRADGYLIGQSIFDRLTYSAHGSAGYALLRTASGGDVAPPIDPTDVNVNTGRFDLWQELSYPFPLGPFKVVPYGVLDLTYYTADVNGQPIGRVYGAGGVRASIPFTRLYPGVQSDLFNLNGINHKIVLLGNYYNAQSSIPFSRLPQLDRLNDDATDQALRDINPLQPFLNPGNGAFLATSPLFDPQVYAIRRLVDFWPVDTRDDIDVFQFDARQRLQTKRGYPGQQHIVDWMTLDLSGSFFPHANRDNFGEHFAFLQYNYLWNIGDRTALESTGWVDPIANGPRVFTVGAYLNRPDRTNFYLGYRQIDPVNSRALTGAVTYVFSPKYATTLSSTYDFGTGQSLSNSLILTRMGSDLQVSLGFTYNAMQNNFGVIFEILPVLATQSRRGPGAAGIGSSMLGGR